MSDPDAERDDATGRVAPEDLVQYLEYAALAGFALFALVGAVGLYTSLGRVIGVWVAGEFQPVFRAGLNLLVLLIAVAGLSTVVRRLAARE